MKKKKPELTEAKAKVNVEAEVSKHENYIEPKKKIFRILFNGEKYKVQYKSFLGKWENWNTYMMGFAGMWQMTAYFVSKEEAKNELIYQYGNTIKIVNDWRAC